MTFASSPKRPPPPPPAATSPPPTPDKKRTRASAPIATAPVVPVLPPQPDRVENRAILPVAELSPAPAPPPEPSTFAERLRAQLDADTPRSAMFMRGPLAPSFSTLDRVASADPRMHDEETERRLQVDHGPFFQRGLEALRSNWHPGEVLEVTERDPARRCGRTMRTTFAVAVLDRSGKVVDVELRAPSGCPDLDDEAIAAFKRVAVFPHPPEGIFVAPDGSQMETARYPVRFIVTFDGGLRLDWRG